MTNRVIDHIVSKVIQHHHDSGTVKDSCNDRDLESIIDQGSDMLGSEIKCADVGYLFVDLIAICERNGTSIETCLNAAYDEMRGIK